MADYMIKGETLTNIANAIRAKSGSSATMTPEQMSTEIENISVGGGDIDALIDGSIEGTITSNVTSVRAYAFYTCSNLSTANFPNATSIGSNAFYKNSTLSNFNAPNVISLEGNFIFYQCSKLKKLVLQSTTIATLSNANAFRNTPIADGTGYIYVPNNLVADYRVATNWSTYASQIFPWVATVEELANIDSTTYTRACVGTENNGTEYTYNGTSWEVVA